MGRVIKRTLEIMKEIGSDDPEAVRKAGGIDLPTIQRYINFWFSSALDLFGADQSSNAATYFATGLKGRPDEANYEDHDCSEAYHELDVPTEDGEISAMDVPMRNAMNEITRQAYIKDCAIGLKRWNRLISKAGYDIELSLPSPRFRRTIGSWAGFYTDPQGNPISSGEWEVKKDQWVRSDADKDFVRSLMFQVTQPGKMANWIAPPDRGINNQDVEYEYVRM